MRQTIRIGWILALCLPAGSLTAAPLGTGFTYQGQLKQNGQLSNGPVNLVIRLYDAGTGGNLLGSQALNGVSVTAGLFTIQLNSGGEFGPLAFNGQARWLEIEVNGTKLSPRQALAVAPYALFAARPWATAGQSISYTGGNVGIGTFSPTAKLEIGGTPGVDGIKFPDGTVQVSASTGGASFWTGIGNDIFNSNSGRVGIGRSDPVFALDVRASDGLGARLGMQGNGGGALVVTSDPGDESVWLEGFNSTGDGSAAEMLITGYNGTSLPELSLHADQIDLHAGITNASGSIVADGGPNVGVRGISTGTGTDSGVHGSNDTWFGSGVRGDSDAGYGVSGFSNSGAGVWGEGSALGVGGYNDGSGVGVRGFSAAGTGVIGASDSGTGVTGTTGSGVGVWAHSWSHMGVFANSDSGVGVWGVSHSGSAMIGASNSNHGIRGIHASDSLVNTDIFAKAGVWGDSSVGNGVMGVTNAVGGAGVVGVATHNNYGVYGYNPGGAAVYGISNVWAGYFDGPLYARSMSSPSKAFRIDHPVDPEHKYLQHSSVESPDMKNIYDGNVTTDDRGYATVALPDYFQALNRDFRYQLTVIGQFARAIISKKIENNQFSIRTDQPNVEVSWQITGIRQDAYAKAHPIVVEEDKPEAEQGKYLTPEVYGQPREAGINYAGPQLAGHTAASQPASP